MQKRKEETFGDIQGVHVIANDFIIAARDNQEHDNILHRVLSRARAKGVKFNSEKVQFKIGKVEYNYAQIENEMLALCFAISKFHQYVYVKPKVSIPTNHKPLESTMKKPLYKAPPRL